MILCHCLGYGASAGGYSNGGGAKTSKPGKESAKTDKLHILKEMHKYFSFFSFSVVSSDSF